MSTADAPSDYVAALPGGSGVYIAGGELALAGPVRGDRFVVVNASRFVNGETVIETGTLAVGFAAGAIPVSGYTTVQLVVYGAASQDGMTLGVDIGAGVVASTPISHEEYDTYALTIPGFGPEYGYLDNGHRTIHLTAGQSSTVDGPGYLLFDLAALQFSGELVFLILDPPATRLTGRADGRGPLGGPRRLDTAGVAGGPRSFRLGGPGSYEPHP